MSLFPGGKQQRGNVRTCYGSAVRQEDWRGWGGQGMLGRAPEGKWRGSPPTYQKCLGGRMGRSEQGRAKGGCLFLLGWESGAEESGGLAAIGSMVPLLSRCWPGKMRAREDGG